MAAVNLGACISASIDDLKKDPVTHIVVMLIIMIASSVSFGLLVGPLQVGYMKMLDKSRRGEPTAIGDVFTGFDNFVPALVASLLGGVAVMVGFVLCIIPGVLIAPLIPAAVYLIAQGEQDGVNALKRGWELLQPNLVMAAVTLMVVSLLAYVGILLCFVGLLVTAPLMFIGQYHLARQMAE